MKGHKSPTAAHSATSNNKNYAPHTIQHTPSPPPPLSLKRNELQYAKRECDPALINGVKRTEKPQNEPQKKENIENFRKEKSSKAKSIMQQITMQLYKFGVFDYKLQRA